MWIVIYRYNDELIEKRYEHFEHALTEFTFLHAKDLNPSIHKK